MRTCLVKVLSAAADLASLRDAYLSLADATQLALASGAPNTRIDASFRPRVTYHEARHKLVIQEGDRGYAIVPAQARRECQCALCREEQTGRQLLDKAAVKETIKPLAVRPTGKCPCIALKNITLCLICPCLRFDISSVPAVL
jgi:hypothetical protein